MNVGMMNPAMFARSSAAPAAQQTQIAQGGGNMDVADKLVKSSQRDKARKAIAGRVSRKLQLKKVSKVGKKKGP